MPLVLRIWRSISRVTMTAGVGLCACLPFALFPIPYSATVSPTFHYTEHALTYSSYHCLFCHGYEDAGKPSSGILAIGDNSAPAAAIGLARSSKQITSKVVIYTSNNPTVQSSIAALLGENDTAITTDDREVTSLALGAEGNGITLTFADGSTVQEAFLAHKPPTKLNGPFAQQLALDLAPGGDIKIMPPFGATSVKGVYAAGDCATPIKSVVQAMHMGTFAGVGIAHDLQAEGPKL